MRTVSFIVSGILLVVVAAGCGDTGSKTGHADEIYTLKKQNRQLTRQLEKADAQNKQSQKQIQVLSVLKSKVKLESIYNLHRVKLTRYTNLYDKDKDGRKESLIVYVQPIDKDGDAIKAAGAVDVQLWDLNKKNGHALLGQWHVKPDQLKKLWFATLITINYRLTFEVADKTEHFDEPLTVKVTFTDHLSGKVFKEQKVIKP